jgi:topoisomerase IA-like protein
MAGIVLTCPDNENEKILLKRGRFGTYIEWKDPTTGEEKRKKLEVENTTPLTTMEWTDIEAVLHPLKEKEEEKEEEKTKNILRRIHETDPEINIRRGKFGSYVYYKRDTDPAPLFLPVSHFPKVIEGGYMECTIEDMMKWIEETLPTLQKKKQKRPYKKGK